MVKSLRYRRDFFLLYLIMNQNFAPTVISHIQKYVHAEPELLESFVNALEYCEFSNKTIILEEGKISHGSYFIISGCVRAYAVDTNGNEHVMHLALENWWIADMYSFITGKPGRFTLQAIENCQLLYLSKTDQEKFYNLCPAIERYFRILMENAYVSTIQRIHDNLSLSAEERYLRFKEKFPSLEHRIPSKYIASYIGVTPEFFSKMRSKLLKT